MEDTPQKGNLGIDNAIPFAQDIGSIITGLVNIDTNKDGHISGMEVFGFLQLATVKVIGRFNTFNEALAEIKDTDSDERNALIAEFSKTFDLTNDDAELLIEEWIGWIEDGGTLVGRTIQLLKKD
jgi:hypothetical protein